MKIVVISLSLLILAGCSGYQVQKTSNPFSKYGINTLLIHNFYNYSVHARSGVVFTKEFSKFLMGFQGLKIVNSIKDKPDAILVGILESPVSNSAAMPQAAQRIVNPRNTEDESRVGRRSFYLPATTNVKLRLRILVIKQPTEKEIKILKSKFAKHLVQSDRVVINEVIRADGRFGREYFNDESSRVLYTQNQMNKLGSLERQAKSSVNHFKNLILYAF